MVNPSKNMHQLKANKEMRNKGQLVNIHTDLGTLPTYITQREYAATARSLLVWRLPDRRHASSIELKYYQYRSF